MSDDDFIRRLQSHWRAQEAGAGAARLAKLRRGRWTPRMLVWLEALQGVVGVAFGVAFTWLAATGDQLAIWLAPIYEARGVSAETAASHLRLARYMLGGAGVVLLLSAPVLAWMAVQARRPSLRWEDETPESVLHAGLRRVDASLRANRVGRWHVWVLVAFVAALWALPVLGIASVPGMAIMTALYLGFIAPLWIWLDLRRERLRREMEACLRLLDELGGDERRSS
jgi:hypothetical protein